jgi:mannose-6-phosphate isomerase-like protein (cupin superfamily)
VKFRRVLVANVDGVSRVVEDGEPPRTAVAVHTPGFASALAWSTPPVPDLAGEDTTVQATTLLPAPGATSAILLTLPPDSVYANPDMDHASAGAEAARNSPGLAELFEPDAPGMHTTPTVDYDVVLEGEVWLELTDGEVHLTQGDMVVQHGTRHAWRNKSDMPATILAVLIGSDQSGATS